MNKLDLHCGSEAQQMALGACLANFFAGKPLLVFLQGDLGAGKTTLVRGFLRGMGYQGSVRSPTYTLVEPYTLADLTVYHLDLYRLADAEELEFLGGREIFAGNHQVLVEWPERGSGWLPEPDLHLILQHQVDGRHVEIRCNAADRARLAEYCTQFLSDASP